MLAEFNALFTAWFVSGPVFTVFRQNSSSVWAIIMVVINLPVLRRSLNRICMVCSHFCHLGILSSSEWDWGQLETWWRRRDSFYGS